MTTVAGSLQLNLEFHAVQQIVPWVLKGSISTIYIMPMLLWPWQMPYVKTFYILGFNGVFKFPNGSSNSDLYACFPTNWVWSL